MVSYIGGVGILEENLLDNMLIAEGGGGGVQSVPRGTGIYWWNWIEEMFVRKIYPKGFNCGDTLKIPTML